jgi:Protein of unknown function (DUF4031)
MTIMVDELKVWPHAKHPFLTGSCHLTTDGDLEELHAFAARIGMRRAWFQDHPTAPHYDLTPLRRQLAVQLGAKEVPAREQVVMRRDARAKSIVKKCCACGNHGRSVELHPKGPDGKDICLECFVKLAKSKFRAQPPIELRQVYDLLTPEQRRKAFRVVK